MRNVKQRSSEREDWEGRGARRAPFGSSEERKMGIVKN